MTTELLCAKLQTFPDASDPFRQGTHSGLDFLYGAGRIRADNVVTDVAADSITLDDDGEEIQTLYLGGADGGTFTLGNGVTNTDPIAFDAVAATIQAALETIYGVGKVVVVTDTDFTITFDASIGASSLEADFTSLTNAVDPALTLDQAYATTDNYIEVDPSDGTVSSNTTGFTSGQFPLYIATAASGEVDSVEDKRAFLSAGGGTTIAATLGLSADSALGGLGTVTIPFNRVDKDTGGMTGNDGQDAKTLVAPVAGWYIITLSFRLTASLSTIFAGYINTEGAIKAEDQNSATTFIAMSISTIAYISKNGVIDGRVYKGSSTDRSLQANRCWLSAALLGEA